MKFFKYITVVSIFFVTTLSAGSCCSSTHYLNVSEVRKIYETRYVKVPYDSCHVRQVAVVNGCNMTTGYRDVQQCCRQYRTKKVRTFVGYKNIAYSCGKKYVQMSDIPLRSIRVSNY
jgi:hypothetical protein